MKSGISIILGVFIFGFCNGQAKNDSARFSPVIKQQASVMADFLLKKDYENFAKYMYPKIIEQGGGKKEVIKLLTKSIQEQEDKGFILIKVEVGDPSLVIITTKEFQCTIPQIITIKVSEGKLVSESTLIGISSDSGKTWTFIDTQGKDIAIMRKIFPNLSPRLFIPKNEKPVLYNK